MPKKIDTDGLFQSTVQLFAQNGYLATTTLEIADKAGINEATLFRRFGSKANLISTALHHCLANSPFAKLKITDDVKTDLIAIAVAYEKTFQAFGGAVITLMVELPRHKELQAASATLMPNYLNAVQIIAHHQEANALKPGNPVQTLTALISPIMISSLLSRSTANFAVPEFSAELLVENFLEGFQMEA